MAKPGRPRVLDETKQREICAIVTAGASLRQAAKYVGCSASTVHREAGRDEVFRERLRRASATAQLAPLQSMREAVRTHWRAAAWMLERADPDKFGRRNPKHFGAKELRALRRDLLAILKDEIPQTGLRQRVVERISATLDYAMRHAWDTRRTGNQLRDAMQYFAKKDGQGNAPEDETMASLDAMLNSFGMPPEVPEFAKPAPLCDTRDQEAA